MVSFIPYSLVTKPADQRTGARGLAASSGSIVLHGAILLSLLIASYLQVKPLAEPRSATEPLILTLSPPPVAAAAAAPPPPRGRPEPRVEETRRAETEPEEIPDTVQPQEVPEEAPPAMADDGDPGLEDGMEFGVPDGVRGGVIGGVKDGIPGGDPHGTSGGVKDGVPDGLPDTDEAIYLTGDVKPPERVTFVKPHYPDLARIARAQGKVILEIVVGRTGAVEEVRVLRSNPLFDSAAVEAVRLWKYLPARLGGRAVTVYLTVIVEFALK